MMRVGKWFERKFAFDIPIELFPTVIERLRGTVPRVEEKIAGLSEEVLTRRENGSWSIQENIGHLLDLESLHTTRLVDFTRGVHVLSAADLNNRKTHLADHNSTPINTLVKSFKTNRSAFIAMAEGLDSEVIVRVALHPRLQQMMNVVDLCYFMAEHDDHHLAKINELRSVS